MSKTIHEHRDPTKDDRVSKIYVERGDIWHNCKTGEEFICADHVRGIWLPIPKEDQLTPVPDPDPKPTKTKTKKKKSK